MTRLRLHAGAALASASLSLAVLLPSAAAQPSTPPTVPPATALPDIAPPASTLPAVAVPPAYTLERLLELARTQSPAFAANRARIEGAEAGLVTARARPNPEFDLQAGRQSASGGSLSGGTGAFGVLQPIDRGALREARRAVAATAIDGVRADASVFERDRIAELTLRYLEVLRLQAAARLAEEDLSIAEQIRTRVQVRVGTGEAPRFELIRADAERLNAQRAVQAAAARIDVARAELRRLVGASLPARTQCPRRRRSMRCAARCARTTPSWSRRARRCATPRRGWHSSASGRGRRSRCGPASSGCRR
jgi:cobalt-zinc-cadmium efflux system outer membrane protein